MFIREIRSVRGDDTRAVSLIRGRGLTWVVVAGPGARCPPQHQDGGATIAGLYSSTADVGDPFGDAVTFVWGSYQS